MKGVVFTEFLEMVESRFSLGMVDDILAKAAPPSGGVYTAVGTYPAAELLALLSALAEASKAPPADLLFAFGEHLFSRFVVSHPALFAGVKSPIDFLSRVDSYIHVEVRKLYPDAELPRFDAVVHDDRRMSMTYHSPRRLSALASGLISGCGKHFGVPLEVSTEDLSDGRGEIVRFDIAQR